MMINMSHANRLISGNVATEMIGTVTSLRCRCQVKSCLEKGLTKTRGECALPFAKISGFIVINSQKGAAS